MMSYYQDEKHTPSNYTEEMLENIRTIAMRKDFNVMSKKRWYKYAKQIVTLLYLVGDWIDDNDVCRVLNISKYKLQKIVLDNLYPFDVLFINDGKKTWQYSLTPKGYKFYQFIRGEAM